MITETELRGALSAKAEGAPDLADIRTVIRARAVGSTRRGSARPVWAGLAAVTVAIVVLGGVLLTGSNKGDGRLPAVGGSSGLNLAYTFTVDQVSGYSITDRFIYADRQSVVFGIPGGVVNTTTDPSNGSVTVATGGTQSIARVDVYARGQYDPSANRRGPTETVPTAPGFNYGSVSVELYDNDADSRANVPTLVWEYAPDSWAVATGFDAAHQTVSVELALARAITVKDNPLLLPAKLQQLPTGLIRSDAWVRAIAGSDSPDSITMVTVGFNRANVAHHGDSDDYVVSMTVVGTAIAATQGTPGSSSPAPIPQATDPIALGAVVAGGRTYTASTVRLQDGSTMYINSDGSQLSLSIGWTDKVSAKPDLRWAQFTPAASMDDTSTWFDASVAIP